MKKTILVTGSEGFIGKRLCKKLSKSNNVIGTFYKSRFKNNGNFILIKCDIRNKNKVFQLIKKYQPNTIFHLAAKSHPTFSFKNPIETMNTNVLGTMNLLEAIKILKLKTKVVLASSSAQFGYKNLTELPVNEKTTQNPEHIYGLSKMIQQKIMEQYLKMYNLNIINAVIFNTSGKGKKFDVFQDLCSQVKKQNKNSKIILSVGNLENQRDFLHVDDTISALEILAQKGLKGESYIISSGRLTKIQKIIELIKVITRKKIIVKSKKQLFRKFDEKNILGDSKKIRKL